MHCTKCGAVVPDGAAFCPNCGGSTNAGSATNQQAAPDHRDPPAKKSNKLLGCLGVGIGGIVLLAIIGSFAPDAEKAGASGTSTTGSEAAAGAPEVLPTAVTAAELFNAYQNNEASAQGYFGEKRLLVSGTVDKVILDFMNDPVVLLRTPNQFMSAQAALADDAKSEAGNFNSGDTVKLLCEGVGEVVSTPMLKDCRSAPAGQKSVPVEWSD